MPRVKFITTGHSHMAGNFSTGDTYTGDEAVCRHFVEDAMCAVWDEIQVSQEVQAPGFIPGVSVFKSRAVLDSELSLLPDGHVDPDYVVRAMRAHFGDVFTDADEATVRNLVKPQLTKEPAPAEAPAPAPAEAPAPAPAEAPAPAPAATQRRRS